MKVERFLLLTMVVAIVALVLSVIAATSPGQATIGGARTAMGATVLADSPPDPLSFVMRHPASIHATEINLAIRQAGAQGGGTISLPAGVITVTESIVIDVDHVTLQGQGAGTIIKLANHANRPVIVVGHTSPIPFETVRKIALLDLTVDGNRAHQDFECHTGDSSGDDYLRNNGISLRRAEDTRIERVAVHSARCSGLVSELGCNRLTVREFRSFDNRVNGLAGYRTASSDYDRLFLYDNLGAGMTLDWAFEGNSFSSVVVRNNGIGIASETEEAPPSVHLGETYDNMFTGLQIRDSAGTGICLSTNRSTGLPAIGNVFQGLIVSRAGDDGVRVKHATCTDNVIAGAQITDCEGVPIAEATPDLIGRSGVMCN